MATQSDIRQKEVVNLKDGRRLGSVTDMEFTREGSIRSITVPGRFRLSALLKGEKSGVTIPWERVSVIGEDVILVDLDPQLLKTLGFTGDRET